MLKMYNVVTTVGDYKVIAFNESHAKSRAYKEYKKTRNTNFDKFKNKISRVTEIK